MGNCASVRKKSGPAMKFSCPIDSRGNCIHIESPVKGSSTEKLNSKPQPLSPMSCKTSFHDLGNREDMFFDSHPWIESDCEDYLSVDGDFTPSCGTTPIHQGSYIETSPREEPLCIITSAMSAAELSPAHMKKQLFELFRENISSDQANGNRSFQDTANGKPVTAYLPPKCTSRSPYQPAESSARRDPKSGKEKPTHSAHCCLPNVVRGLSLSERKKGLSPAYGGGQ